jgi:hypothetical protein
MQLVFCAIGQPHGITLLRTSCSTKSATRITPISANFARPTSLLSRDPSMIGQQRPFLNLADIPSTNESKTAQKLSYNEQHEQVNNRGGEIDNLNHPKQKTE